jgi:hypothetical protein
MIVQDRAGREWKVSADESTVYFHMEKNPAPAPVVSVPVADLAGYSLLEPSERERFRRELGMRIGLPLWPLFITTSFEAEVEHLRTLGVFGSDELLVPMTLEQALEIRPDLAPDEEELKAYARERSLYLEWLRESAVCAVCLKVGGREDEAVRERMEEAGSCITSCVVCLRPATHVGLHADEGDELILHGLCRSCRAKDQGGEPGRTVREALDMLERLGSIRTFGDEDPS